MWDVFCVVFLFLFFPLFLFLFSLIPAFHLAFVSFALRFFSFALETVGWWSFFGLWFGRIRLGFERWTFASSCRRRLHSRFGASRK
jgi:hypothetical protein